MFCYLKSHCDLFYIIKSNLWYQKTDFVLSKIDFVISKIIMTLWYK